MFPYYYKGGEIHCLKYGSMYKDEERLFRLIQEEEQFMIGVHRKLKIWVDFYKTSITDRVIQELINHLSRISLYVERLSIVGLSPMNAWRLKKQIKKSGLDLNIRFYADPEDAKTWLVTEKNSLLRKIVH